MFLRFRLTAALIGAFSSTLLPGQPAGAIFSKAPPEVESALRARFMQFLELQQQKKYRQAEALVCEESKDTYYGAEKRHLDKWEFSEFVYEDGHRKATAIVLYDAPMPTMSGMAYIQRPYATRWKVENGNWCVYFPDPLLEGVKTPFGYVKLEDRKEAASAASLFAKRPKVDAKTGPVAISKRSIELAGTAESSDAIEIRNLLPGPVTVEVEAPSIPGLTWHVEPREIPANGRGAVRFEFRPAGDFPRSDTQFSLVIRPLDLKVPVAVVFRTAQGGGQPAVPRP
jgi:hypothetical protein